MIYGIGIDIEKIENINRIYQKYGNKFLEKIFSCREIELFEKRNFSSKIICANFCAKEAFSKAVGTGFSGISLSDISVLRDKFGKPYIVLGERLHNNLIKRINDNYKIQVSISHTDEIAEAIVIIEY